MLRPLLLTFLMLLAAPLAAQDTEIFTFSDDAYMAGQSVSHTGADVDDLFAAGDRVTASAPLGGSAHMVGRNVTVSGDVGGSLYAAGRNVTLSSTVAGDALMIGENVDVSGEVTGDLRAMGSSVEVNAPVGQAALLAGESLYINAAIAGDLGFATDSVEFGPDAVVAGQVHIYSDDPEAVEVPSRVASGDQIVLHQAKDWGGVNGELNWEHEGPSAWQKFRGFIGGILAIGVLTTILAAIAPGFVGKLREYALASPLRTGWIGFLALSATIGSLVIFAMTGFGILLVPVSIIASVLLGLVGYLIGTYVLGVGVLGLAGRDVPDSLGDRAIAAFAGAAAAAVIGLIPFVGWLFTLALVLVGAGAIITRWFEPGFYTFN